MNFTFFRFEKRNEFILKVAGNKIRLAARLGVPLAENWITDENGKVIEEELENVPNKFYMAPMGGTRENSSHKGILINSSNFCQLPLSILVLSNNLSDEFSDINKTYIDISAKRVEV